MNKRGVSEIVSYAILIAIAVSLALFVYAYLRLYVPKPKPECPDEINLVIEEASCKYTTSASNITIKIQNRGLFSVDYAYIRIGKEELALPISNGPINLSLAPSSSSPYLFLKNLPKIVSQSGNYILEVQPVIKSKKYPDDPEKWALCKPVTQTVFCG